MIEWFQHILRFLPDFYDGLLITLRLTLVGLALGMGIGIPAALARVYGSPWIRRIAIGYIEFIRGTPLLVQLFIIYFGLPQFNINLPRMTAAYLALGLNSGAYQAEYFRGAIQAVESGQMMAARAMGMTRFQAIRHVILPQAVRIVIPPWSNEPILLLKSSAVAFLVAVPDLMTKAKIIITRTYDPIGTYLAVAVFYLIIVLLLTGVLETIERRVRIPGLEIEVVRH